MADVDRDVARANGMPPLDAAESIRDEIRRLVEQPFGVFTDVFRLQVRLHPEKTALVCGDRSCTYGELDDLADRCAYALQRDSIARGSVVAICAATSIAYVAAFIGALRTGAAVSPLATSASPEQLAGMLRDSGAAYVFVDREGRAAIGDVDASLVCIGLESGASDLLLEQWLPPAGAPPRPVAIAAGDPFDIIYSSGTTGTPKGIVQPHAMRWPQLHLVDPPGYGPDAVAIISTPLYSNTTLVSLLPALAGGGTVVLMPRFDAREFLVLSERHRATVAMLVPVQYRRILDVPEFDRFDLSSYSAKYATSAPFAAALKAEVLARWPGGLTEYYGMTEGGGSCMLVAHERPDKLHTVGQPIDGHDMRVIDEHGDVVPAGTPGEVVGRSNVMMTGYHNRPDTTSAAEWTSPEGLRFIRTGDVGYLDDEGFFTLTGRKKDMIISGGINVYPIDLERALCEHPDVREAAVVGAPSQRWGETPVGYVSLRDGASISGQALRAFANAKLGKMQRLADVRTIAEMPRNAIGKILKRELVEMVRRHPVD